ncbi:hypothetical protein [Bacillus sp. FJAT-27264]|uniref:hypothetical protein n=1 Tax=Paenibacillus sp. (strain DSM 101736 / FJAT-27264) TaxID=1850362 RepID=UPI0011122A9D|nr:hypothetical protein [Bacillus sp. FJAT-27264]
MKNGADVRQGKAQAVAQCGEDQPVACRLSRFARQACGGRTRALRQAGPVDLDGAGQGRTRRQPGGPAKRCEGVDRSLLCELRVLQQQDTQSVDAVCVLLHQPAEIGPSGVC